MTLEASTGGGAPLGADAHEGEPGAWLYGPRPAAKYVCKDVKLPDGTVLKDFPVLVADPPEDNFAENKARPGFVDEHGRVPPRGSGS